MVDVLTLTDDLSRLLVFRCRFMPLWLTAAVRVMDHRLLRDLKSPPSEKSSLSVVIIFWSLFDVERRDLHFGFGSNKVSTSSENLCALSAS
jgi:hypothetical protein